MDRGLNAGPNSTIVRTNGREAVDWQAARNGSLLHAGAAFTARVAPGVAAALLEVLFRRVRRHPVPGRERGWLARARRLPPVTAFGRRLPVWSWGEGPTVLLVHGWEGRGSQMGAFAEALAAAGFRAVAYDAPAHGASRGSMSSMPALWTAVEAVTTAVGPVAGLVAHSAGAAATARAMARGLPVGRAVFAAPAADPGRFLGVAADWLGLPPEVARRTQRRIERRFDMRFEDLSVPAMAPALDVPLLVVHDRDDAEVPWREGEAIAASWPGARLVTTDGLGHRRLLREPAVVEQAVRFLGAG
jgi:pimeloyl-ACP methyl ester carboxylesterase